MPRLAGVEGPPGVNSEREREPEQQRRTGQVGDESLGIQRGTIVH